MSRDADILSRRTSSESRDLFLDVDLRVRGAMVGKEKEGRKEGRMKFFIVWYDALYEKYYIIVFVNRST